MSVGWSTIRRGDGLTLQNRPQRGHEHERPHNASEEWEYPLQEHVLDAHLPVRAYIARGDEMMRCECRCKPFFGSNTQAVTTRLVRMDV